LTISAVPPTTVFIAAISSDIGQSMAKICRSRGWNVIGTYRDKSHLGALTVDDSVSLIRCDVTDPGQIDAVAQELAERGLGWDLFISAIGQLSPIGPFATSDRSEWVRSVTLNGGGQMALLHAAHPFRRARPYARVAFLVGGAINRAFSNYSAYSLGKVGLVKFCELIHDECPDIHAVAVGTGWVATKIHLQTIAAADHAGDNLERTRHFLASGEQGSSVSDIMACIEWCFSQGRETTGGRNFSVVHDSWRDGGAALAASLLRDSDRFKLRRHGNSSIASTADA
jgi:NAD(P)-dependent dehydrogenase (short-subunit alcohol dehydrogenase family)